MGVVLSLPKYEGNTRMLDNYRGVAKTMSVLVRMCVDLLYTW